MVVSNHASQVLGDAANRIQKQTEDSFTKRLPVQRTDAIIVGLEPLGDTVQVEAMLALSPHYEEIEMCTSGIVRTTAILTVLHL